LENANTRSESENSEVQNMQNISGVIECEQVVKTTEANVQGRNRKW
jgi:hypothetical protein